MRVREKAKIFRFLLARRATVDGLMNEPLDLYE